MFTVMLRGLAYRPGRSAIVLLLAIAATAAAVLTPGYTRVAQESLLRDELRGHADSAVTTNFVSTVQGAGGDVKDAEGEPMPGPGNFADYPRYLADEAAKDPDLDALMAPVSYLSATTIAARDGWNAQSKLTWRQDVCDHVDVVDGDCRTEGAEVLMSQRSAQRRDIEVGDTITLTNEDASSAGEAEYEVGGIYQPRDSAEAYWGGSGHFGFTRIVRQGETPALDALLATDPAAMEPVGQQISAGVEYRLDIDAITLSNIDAPMDRLRQLERNQVSPNPDESEHEIRWSVQSRLPSMVTAIASEQAAIAVTVPVVAIPLLLMCWFVLYLMVAHVVEERGPELAVAKLRGHRFGAFVSFGLGETIALIVIATPLGVLAGLAAVQRAARLLLAEGTSVEFTAEVAWYALAAFAGAMVAVMLAARKTLRRPVVDLLRRVQARGRGRGWIAEAVLAALTVAALYQVFGSDRFDDFGLLVTPLLALLTGMLVARAMTVLARRRLAGAWRKGALSRAVTLARIARRGEWRRVVVLVTVAVSLLTFGVATWDIAERNRELVASDRFGADSVYSVSQVDPERLMDIVDQLDPKGDKLVPVIRSSQRYDNEVFTQVAVDSGRFARVADWRGHDRQQLAEVAEALRPQEVDSLRVSGDLAVDVTVNRMEAEQPPSLALRVARDGEAVETVRADRLEEGSHTYAVDLPDCDDDCRLLGVGVGRYPGDLTGISFDITIDGIRDHDGEVDSGLDEDGRWRTAAGTPANADLNVTSDGEATEVSVAETGSYDDLFAEYAAIPKALPTVLAGDVPDAETGAKRFEFLGPHGELQDYRVSGHAEVIPRGGPRGVLLDLEYTGRAAEPFGPLTQRSGISYEIWADDAAGDLGKRLGDQGLTVNKVEHRADYLQRLGRYAPPLAFRLHLMAAAAALLLCLGTVILNVAAGAASRGRDNAGLRVAGVRPVVLARAMRREFLWIVAPPLVAGAGCGLAGAWLILPRVALISTDPPQVPPEYWPGPWWLPGAFGVAAVSLLGCALVLAGVQRAYGRPDRLRGAER